MTNTTFNSKRAVENLRDDSAQFIASNLNILLADEFKFFTKTLNYHWNITGPRFRSLHEFLEDNYKELLSVMDAIAERVRIVGENPISTVKEMNDHSKIIEFNGATLSSNQMLEDLWSSCSTIQTRITDILEESDKRLDPGTEDFLVGVLRKHEMMNWKIKSHLD